MLSAHPLSIAGFIGAGLDFSSQQRLMWYILFVVYAPYAMLPLPLRWCVLAGYGTALTHMVMAGITLLRDPTYVRILGLQFSFYKLTSPTHFTYIILFRQLFLS